MVVDILFGFYWDNYSLQILLFEERLFNFISLPRSTHAGPIPPIGYPGPDRNCPVLDSGARHPLRRAGRTERPCREVATVSVATFVLL